MSYAQKYHNLLSIGKIMQYEIDNHNMILNFDQIYDETEYFFNLFYLKINLFLYIQKSPPKSSSSLSSAVCLP